ncbi:SPOR domain-containing protein [Acetobacteraceae bacterium H6797]|nr:SPOR domain-containing protein [Acetobacteraceae bacterium H6797]
MNENQYPSYRLRQPEPDGPPWRMLAMAGGIVAIALVAVVIVWSLSRGGGGVPVIEADARPVKVRPDDPGGLRVPNQGELIFDQRPQSPTAGRLAPAPETPNLAQLRAQTTTEPVQLPGSAPVPANPTLQPQQPQHQAAPPAQPSPPPGIAPTSTPIPPRAAQPAQPPAAPAAAVVPPLPAGTPKPGAVARVQVQLGALASEEAAKQEWERLSRRMPDLLADRRPQIMRFERGAGQSPMFRLRTGFFTDGPTAATFCESVKARGGVCAVIGG